ncbi:MAG TPA: hypothetical protein VF892_13430, partial [Pseudonocardiaceae bacterium]
TPQAGNPDPMNPRSPHEYATEVRDSFAHLGADLFGIGGLISHPDPPRPTTPQANRPTTPTTATTPTTSATGQVNSPASGSQVSRDARREQLQNDRLEQLNIMRGQQGEAPLTELPATELAAIESQLDAEGVSSGGNDAPVVHGWSEFKDQFRIGGGELLGSFIGYNPVEAAERKRHEEEAEARTAQQQQQQTGAVSGASNTTTATAGAAAAGAAGISHGVGHPDRPVSLEPTGADLARLYDRIHTRLVRELLVGRERAGSLMDFR